MNYKKIYKQLMEKAASEDRMKGGKQIYEFHHIVPDFMFERRKRKGVKGHLPGSSENPQNIVLLTTREHLVAHLLLCKMLKGKRYEYQAYCSLNLLMSGGNTVKGRSNLKDAIKNISLYSKKREEARQIISNHRKYTMPVKDSITGQIIGSVRTDHPKCLSGEWVHHSKGRSLTLQRKKEISKQMKGEGNTRFCGISNEQILEEYLILTEKLSRIPTFDFFRKVFFEKHKIKLPSYFSAYRFNYGRELIEIACTKYNLRHEPTAKWAHKLNPKDFI